MTDTDTTTTGGHTGPGGSAVAVGAAVVEAVADRADD